MKEKCGWMMHEHESKSMMSFIAQSMSMIMKKEIKESKLLL
jgi:hypothetical protein